MLDTLQKRWQILQDAQPNKDATHTQCNGQAATDNTKCCQEHGARGPPFWWEGKAGSSGDKHSGCFFLPYGLIISSLHFF